MQTANSGVKYPNCDCGVQKYEYFRRHYRNGSDHLFRRCPECGRVAQSPMKQNDYDRNWIQSLPLLRKRTAPPERHPARHNNGFRSRRRRNIAKT